MSSTTIRLCFGFEKHLAKPQDSPMGLKFRLSCRGRAGLGFGSCRRSLSKHPPAASFLGLHGTLAGHIEIMWKRPGQGGTKKELTWPTIPPSGGCSSKVVLQWMTEILHHRRPTTSCNS